jgi:uncharacterized membrane protein
MTAKILATLTAIVGGISVVYALLVAAGIEMSSQLQDAITGVLGLVLIVAGIWLHPSTSVGVQPPGE